MSPGIWLALAAAVGVGLGWGFTAFARRLHERRMDRVEAVRQARRAPWGDAVS